jgi:predicted ABC-type ATPase
LSLLFDFLDKRPLIIALAGSNGAGKSTFYDSYGEKVDQLASYEALGYTVVLIFIRIESPDESIKRVAMRASQGGHDVPDAKLRARFACTQANLKRAIQRLPHVIVYSNEDLGNPYRFVAYYENGQKIERGTTP